MYKKTFAFMLSLIFGLAILVSKGGNAAAQVEDPQMMPVNQIIVKYKTDAKLDQAVQARAADQMQRLNEAAGVRLDYFRPMSGDAHVLRLGVPTPVEEVLAITARIVALPEVAYAEPDYIAFPMETSAPVIPNDTRYPDQWHYFAPTAGTYGVNAPSAWGITKGDSDIYIAVLDTGITDHVDLAGRWIGGYDMITEPWRANDNDGRDSDPHDPGDWSTSGDPCDPRPSSWHGTHVAGTIGAATNNNMGVAGLNWVSKIVPVRVLGKCGNETSDIADGIRWAAGLPVEDVPENSHPAQVINMSLGGPNLFDGCSATYQNAINDAYNAGSVIVVSAGNSNVNASIFQPASCDHVITVAATARDGDRASYSNYGDVVEISAPGGDSGALVLSTLNTGDEGPEADSYAYYGGTSMAAPHVSGVASLMLSLDPLLSPNQVLTLMQGSVTAFPAGSTCNTNLCGSGIANAGAAVATVLDVKPAAPILSTIVNPYGDSSYTVDWNDVYNADEYTLQEDDNASFSSPATESNIPASQYTAENKTAGAWYYRVRAENSNGVSAWSNTVSTSVKPEAPDLNTISNPGGADSYTVSWSAEAGADGYLLQEDDKADFIGATTRYMGAATQYQVTGQAGEMWYYRVQAYNGAPVPSDWSNVETVTVTPSTLAPPNLQLIQNPDKDNSFTVDWDGVPDATTYILEESDNQFFVDPVVVHTGAATEKSFDFHAGGTWYFRARAANDTDQGPWSDWQSTTVIFEIYLPVIPKSCASDPAGESDNINDALTVCSGQTLTGQVSDSDWDDVYRIYARNGQSLSLSMSGTGGGDADLYLYAPGSTDIYEDDPAAWSQTVGSSNESIQGTVLLTGYWYIDVYSYKGTIDYKITVNLSNSTSSQSAAFPVDDSEFRPRRTR